MPLISRALVLLALLLVPLHESLAQQDAASDELLVAFTPGARGQETAAAHREAGGETVGEIPQLGVHRVHIPPGLVREAVAEAYRHNPNVRYVERNEPGTFHQAPNDAYYPNQYGLSQANVPASWSVTHGTVPIAILDTGAEVTNPDLAGKIDGRSWNYETGSADLTDDVGHGTGTAGVAAAVTNNGQGVAGTCWGCPVVVAKINNGSTPDSFAIAAALTDLADKGVRVASMSFEVGWTQTLNDALAYAWSKGMVLIASTGNDGNAAGAGFPANAPPVLPVGGSTATGGLWSGSNVDPSMVLAAADGVYGLYPCALGGCVAIWTGTSESAPLVAGVAGLLLSANPGLTNQQVVDTLRNTALSIGPSGGYGLVNAGAALGSVAAPLPAVTPPPPVQPQLTPTMVSPVSSAPTPCIPRGNSKRCR